VTIANQDRQIKLLIDRLSKLGDELTESKAQRDAVESAYGSASEMLATLTHRVAESDIAYARLQGWQDCAREMLEKRS
jgi:ABC-type transporter Mla subunit MlaD